MPHPSLAISIATVDRTFGGTLCLPRGPASAPSIRWISSGGGYAVSSGPAPSLQNTVNCTYSAYPVASADINGDNRADLSWYRWYYCRSTGCGRHLRSPWVDYDRRPRANLNGSNSRSSGRLLDPLRSSYPSISGYGILNAGNPRMLSMGERKREIQNTR